MNILNNKAISIQHLIGLIFFLTTSCHSQSIEIEGTIFSHQLIEVGEGESTIAISDVNADSHSDVVISNLSDNNLIVFLGDGDGNLSNSGYFHAGEQPTDLTTADINNDGFNDLVIANHETSYLTILNGDGLGGFQQAPNSPLSVNVKSHPHTVRLQNLDGDENADLIVDSRAHNGLLILKGLGNNFFKMPGKLFEVGTDPYRGFATGDVNNDGLVNIATPNQNEIGLFLNLKSENILFGKKNSVVSESPFAVELADINGDGAIDLIKASEGGLVEIIPGNGLGEFLTEKKSFIRMNSGAKQIAIGDINGDNITDVLISSWSSEVLAIIGGRRNFNTMHFRNESIPNTWGLAIADLNEDGKCDFIIADGNNNLASVYISQLE